MRNKLCYLFLVGLLMAGKTSHAQMPNLDSLKARIESVSGNELISLLLDLSYYTSFTDPKESTAYALKALNIALEKSNINLAGEAYNGLAISYLAEGKYRLALDANKKSWSIRSQNGTDYQKLSSLSKMGNCFHELGYYDSALVYFLRSLEICEKNHLEEQKALIYNNIAEVEKRMGNFEQAKKYYDYAIITSGTLGDTLGLAKAKMNLAIQLKNEKDYSKAGRLFNEVEQLIKNKHYLEALSGLYLNLGVLNKETGNIDECIKYYRLAENIYIKTNEIHGYSLLCSNLGNTLLELKNSAEALNYFKKALDLANESGSVVLKKNALDGLSHYYATVNDFENAYSFQTLARKMNDSIFTSDNARTIEELRVQYESEKKEKQLAEQKAQISEEKRKVQKRNIYIVLTCILALGLFLAIFLIRSRYRGKQLILQQKLALEKARGENRIQNEKLRISRDLHDNIGSQLSYIVSALENLGYYNSSIKKEQRRQEILQFSKNTISGLRETIWALNASAIPLKTLANRIKELFNLHKRNNKQLNFNLEFKDPEHEFSTEEGIHIYRSIQEACNNTIKHSLASEINMEMNRSGFVFSDNGTGVDFRTTEKGNGLINMKKRMEEIGYTFTLISEPGKGTTIKAMKYDF